MVARKPAALRPMRATNDGSPWSITTQPASGLAAAKGSSPGTMRARRSAGTPKSPGGSTPSGATIRKRRAREVRNRYSASRQATSGSSRSATDHDVAAKLEREE